MPTSRRPYSADFRHQMVELVRAGRTLAELSKEFGCHSNSVLKWVRQTDTANYFAERKSRADLAAFKRILKRKGGEPPRAGDQRR